ncbi:MAG: SLOG family protein [Bacillota bacterium]|nr:SLOG family protein [Bacillota bacterium]
MDNAVCFTGKRPNSMPWGNDESNPLCIDLKERIESAVEMTIKKGYTHFITGMAQGADIFCAEAVIKLKERYPHITLEAAVPCPEQTERWGWSYKRRYSEILGNCSSVKILRDKYVTGCMQERNRYMVDNARLVIAIYNGSGGGTASTIKYARNKGRFVCVIGF